LNDWLAAIATGDLCQELTALAEQTNLHFPYAHKPRVLGRRLNNLKSNLEEFFEIVETEGKQRKRYFSFKPLGQIEGNSESD